MNIIPRKPFEELDGFFRDDDWFFPVFSKRGSFEPDMDVYETEKEVVAKVSLPDIDVEDVKVSVEDGILKVSGEFEDEEKEEGKDYWRKEIRSGSFQRATRLPSRVDEVKTKARYEKGVLTITLPKVEEKKQKGKEIKIEAK